MVKLPEAILDPVASLTRLPGVGEKSALRMVNVLSSWSNAEIDEFVAGINKLKELESCQYCGMWCDEDSCEVCADSERYESGILCVVETPADFMAIEKSRQFKGRFLVLKGVLNPLLGVGPSDLNFDLLQKEVEQNQIKTVILALNPSVEGDATCAYIKQILPEDIRVERIGFGMPIGGSLEYVDSLTVAKALENRRSF